MAVEIETVRRKLRKVACVASVSLLALISAAAGAHAAPIMGYVNEQNFLEFAIDHHFSALRATELAAGTATVGSSSNFAGSPISFLASPQKATNPIALDIAIDANASQRADIVMIQGFLNTYYGIPNYPPVILPSNQGMLDMLEATPSGDPFNVAFLQMFIEHHLELLPAAQECSSVAPHADVRSMCSTMVNMQTQEIAVMQAELRNTYGINPVPEPGGLGLILAGLAAVFGFAGYKRHNSRTMPWMTAWRVLASP